MQYRVHKKDPLETNYSFKLNAGITKGLVYNMPI